jgi:predicted RNase H-like HicB family nuclease
MKLPLIIEQDEDGWFVVDCPAIPGCATQGKTRAEALANIREAIDLSLEFRRAKGMPLVLETSEIEVRLIA